MIEISEIAKATGNQWDKIDYTVKEVKQQPLSLSVRMIFDDHWTRLPKGVMKRSVEQKKLTEMVGVLRERVLSMATGKNLDCQPIEKGKADLKFEYRSLLKNLVAIYKYFSPIDLLREKIPENMEGEHMEAVKQATLDIMSNNGGIFVIDTAQTRNPIPFRFSDINRYVLEAVVLGASEYSQKGPATLDFNQCNLNTDEIARLNSLLEDLQISSIKIVY